MSENEVIPAGQYRVEPVQATPMALIEMAVAQGADVEKLQKLFELQLRWEQNEARKAYFSAITEFKKSAPKITKNKDVLHNGVFKYRHTTLDNINNVVIGKLSEVGISHRWETEDLEGGDLRVTCVLSHELGHSERTPLKGSPDTSGGKNTIQARGSTLKYLERYTLFAALGLADGEDEDDGMQGKAKEFPAAEKASLLDEIDMLETTEQAEALWGRIATASKAYGDVEAHDELRGAMAKKRKKLTSAAKPGVTI